MNRQRQLGVTTVEVAIVGTVALLVLFAVIELGRAMFVLNALGESTRRAARIAAVCPLDDPAIADVAMFNAPGDGGSGRIVAGLAPDNIVVEYVDGSGAAIGDPLGNYLQINFVRVRIVNFQHRMLIPFADYIFTTPEFATTVRRESLGVPRSGVVEPC
jgi:Flp pilus assembly protein TadG